MSVLPARRSAPAHSYYLLLLSHPPALTCSEVVALVVPSVSSRVVCFSVYSLVAAVTRRVSEDCVGSSGAVRSLPNNQLPKITFLNFQKHTASRVGDFRIDR